MSDKTNSQIFRKKITNFDSLIKYTQKVLNSEIEYECLENGNILTKDICFHNMGNTPFYISENTEPRLDYEVLFWEKRLDRFNPFSSAGRLSRLVRKLFKKAEQTDELRRFPQKRVEKINDKIKNLFN